MAEAEVLPRVGLRPALRPVPADGELAAAEYAGSRRAPVLVVAGIGVPIVVWLIVIFAVAPIHLAVVAPRLQISMEAAGDLARLFAAFVLFLAARDRIGAGIRWVAAGFLVLGLGGLIFGYVPFVADFGRDVNASASAWLLIRTLAAAFFCIGLLPAAPPHFPRWAMLVLLATFGPACIALIASGDPLPNLLQVRDLAASAAAGELPLDGLTAWYYLLASVPLTLSVATVWGAVRRSQTGDLPVWVVAAMVLAAGSQLHSMFWPTAFSPVLSTPDILRFSFAVVVVIGGILELHRIAGERTALLDREQDRAQHYAELNAMKTTFERMIAHELGSPVAALRRYTDILQHPDLKPEIREKALQAMRNESAILATLIADVHTAANLEREDFAFRPAPVSLRAILEDAILYGQTIAGGHPLQVASLDRPVTVWADRERIGQVLRNLLNNAVKYSPPGAGIELRAVGRPGHVRLEVADQGRGIERGDADRIFEKFERGRDQRGGTVPGFGLGLYISRRLVAAHGTRLTVVSAPGAGAVFGFDLSIVR